MPAKSAKQYGLMQVAKRGTMKGIGPSPAVAREMIGKTSPKQRSKFAKQLAKKRKMRNNPGYSY